MRTLAIVPVKNFDTAKQRLAASLAPGARESLAQAMFNDVMAALPRCRLIDAIAVVTSDSGAEWLAREHATVLRDTARAGQSAAADIGTRHAIANRFGRVILLPGDTPLIDPTEVDALLERTERDGIDVGIVADRHGTGTNALVIAPPDAFVPRFGPSSLARHVAAAEEAGVSFRLELAPSLAHDVDTPEDLADLWEAIDESRSRAPRTRGMLRQLDRSGGRGATTPGRSASDTAAAAKR